MTDPTLLLFIPAPLKGAFVIILGPIFVNEIIRTLLS